MNGVSREVWQSAMHAARGDCSRKSGYENRLTLLTVFVCAFTNGATAHTYQMRILFNMHRRVRCSETVYASPTLRAMPSLLDQAFYSQVFGRLSTPLLLIHNYSGKTTQVSFCSLSTIPIPIRPLCII